MKVSGNRPPAAPVTVTVALPLCLTVNPEQTQTRFPIPCVLIVKPGICRMARGLIPAGSDAPFPHFPLFLFISTSGPPLGATARRGPATRAGGPARGGPARRPAAGASSPGRWTVSTRGAAPRWPRSTACSGRNQLPGSTVLGLPVTTRTPPRYPSHPQSPRDRLCFAWQLRSLWITGKLSHTVSPEVGKNVGLH